MWADLLTWLGTLPPGSASFIGTLTGSFLGLVALLFGALFNAYLNRRRDDGLRSADRLAMASALHAELLGIHRAFVDNLKFLEEKPPDAEGGFMVPEPSVKLLPEMLPKIGLLRPETIRKVLDAYVLTEQYLEGLILRDGKLHPDMPEGRQLVYLPAQRKSFVIQFNRAKAGVVKEAIDALAPYLKEKPPTVKVEGDPGG
jgi:hypothetical protein